MTATQQRPSGEPAARVERTDTGEWYSIVAGHTPAWRWARWLDAARQCEAVVGGPCTWWPEGQTTYLGWPLDPVRPGGPARRGCEVDGCERPHKARGLCDTHYDKKRRDDARANKAAAKTRAWADMSNPERVTLVANAWRTHRPSQRAARESLGLSYVEWAPLFDLAQNWGLA